MNDGIEFLLELQATIDARRTAKTEDSYTARLFAAGPSRIAQKVGEEGVELAIAAVQGDRPRITAEASDLVYHLVVLLRSHDLRLEDVAAELERRGAPGRATD